MMRTPMRVGISCIVLGVVSALCAGCHWAADDAAPAAVVDVKVEKPSQGAISEHILADATLSPLAQAAISPRITAPVRRFYVQRGAHVKAGELLATLENTDLTAAALDNEGAYGAAQASYKTQTQAQIPEEYQRAQLDLTQAKATLDLNQSIVKSRKELFAQGAIPGRDLDTAEATLVQARAAYDTAQQHLAALKDVSRQAAVEQAQGQLTSAKAKYMGAEAQVSFSQIRSPISGVVTDRSLFAGETASSGTTLITVMDTSALLAKVHLSQTATQRLKLGDAATVMVPGMPDPVPAKVSLISPALDPGSTTVEVWLRLENPGGRLKAGTPVRVSITGRMIASAIKIPMAAVLTAQDGSKTVMIVGADNKAHARPVKLGIEDGEDVQVISGLSQTDQVITEGAYGLDDGTAVKAGAGDSDDKPGKAAGDPN